jgi:hypothetical protein
MVGTEETFHSLNDPQITQISQTNLGNLSKLWMVFVLCSLMRIDALQERLSEIGQPFLRGSSALELENTD